MLSERNRDKGFLAPLAQHTESIRRTHKRGPMKAQPLLTRRGILLSSLSIYPDLAKRYRVISCLSLRAEVQLAFHAMNLLYGLREVDRKHDSFGMPALVICRGRSGSVD
jgi:Flp pilus assembly CpaE family ATPase